MLNTSKQMGKLYKVGDEVKVREFSDMLREFPNTDDDGDIMVRQETSVGLPHFFTQAKGKLSGQTIKIEVVHEDGYESEGASWCDEMFESEKVQKVNE